MITPVILSGGSGTRLWPLSTAKRPKQFLPLLSEHTLFSETLSRVDDPAAFTAPMIIANVDHEQLCIAELAGRSSVLLLEPVARNTAPAVLMAALLVAETDPDGLLLVMPSDHRIDDLDAFKRAIGVAAMAARSGKLVTFGITPTAPETGYGYLQAGRELDATGGAFAVSRFVEKPSKDVAKEMLETGRHYWNGGIFLFSAKVFVDECRQHAPEIHACGEAAMQDADRVANVVRPAIEPLLKCPAISVDYAVMEVSDLIAVVPLDAGWSDVGSWDALADIAQPEDADNPRMLDCSDCFVRSDGVEVSMLGVEGLIVVATGNRVVIMRKGRSQEIKRLAVTG